MATSAIAAPAAAPAPSAPAAPAPASPASTPAPAATPQPTGTPDQGGAPQSTPAASPEKSTYEILREKIAAGFEGDPEQGAEAGDVPQIGDAEAQPEGEAQPLAEGETDYSVEPDEWQPTPSIAAKDLAAQLSANPELAAALDASPELKNQIFANARRSERLAQYEEIVSSPEDVRTAVEQHTQFANLQTMLASVKDEGSAAQFIQSMVQQSILRDENGEPIVDEKTGRPKNDGSVYRFLRNSQLLRYNALRQKLEANNDDEGLASLDNIMEREGFAATSTPSDDDLPEQFRSQRDEIQRQQQALDQQKAEAQRATAEAFTHTVKAGALANFDVALASLMGKADGLDPATRADVQAKIETAVEEAVSRDEAFFTRKRSLEMRPQTDKVRSEMIALHSEAMKKALRKVGLPILADAGNRQLQTQQSTEATQAARAAAARSEVRGSLSQAKPALPTDKAAQYAMAKGELVKQGKEPSMANIISWLMQNRNAQGQLAAR